MGRLVRRDEAWIENIPYLMLCVPDLLDLAVFSLADELHERGYH